MSGWEGTFEPGRILRILAWVHVVLSGIALALGGMFFVMAAADQSYAETILPWYGPLFLTAAALWFLPAFIGGLGLLRGRLWAVRVVAAGSFVMLFLVPIGTIMGAVSLWILFRDTDARERIGQAALRIPNLKNVLRTLGLIAISMAILGAIIGLGYIFRDQIEHWEPPGRLMTFFIIAGGALLVWGIAVLGRQMNLTGLFSRRSATREREEPPGEGPDER